MGVGRYCNKLFLIDFGLAKEYRNSGTGVHIPYREGKVSVVKTSLSSFNYSCFLDEEN